MAAPLHLSEAFTQAWRLAEALDDLDAQAQLVTLRRHSFRFSQDHPAQVLDEVAALMDQLRGQLPEGGRSGHAG